FVYGVHNVLYNNLRIAVGIGRAARMALIERQALWIAVYGRRRREDEGPHARIAHRLEQARTAIDVIVVVSKRARSGFSDCLQTREMQDSRYIVTIEHLPKQT